jgi:ATP-dependent DNA helicase PIF1
MTEIETITLTNEHINACRTINNGFTKETFNSFQKILKEPFGTNGWALETGWIDRLIGLTVSLDDYNNALQGKSRLIKQSTPIIYTPSITNQPITNQPITKPTVPIINYELSTEQQNVIDLIKEGKNVFISGSGGTGKTYLLNAIKQIIPNVHLTATTGIAAVHIHGRTIHSWSGIKLGNLPISQLKFDSSLCSKIRNTKILAIDEISMLSADTFDLINEVVKKIRKSENPFGNIQLIIFGDFHQLRPVSGDYCFNSNTWKELQFVNIILKKVFRQSDEIFIDLLTHVRCGDLKQSHIDILTNRISICGDEIQPTVLVSHNAQADLINKNELHKISGKMYTYKAKYRGIESKIEFLKKNCLAYDQLEIKNGCKVMMIKNTYSDQGIINGSVGIIKDIQIYPIVLFENGVEIKIIPELWTVEKLDEITNKVNVDASIEQIPLIFAWAITIHKSQGMTLDKIRCNLRNTFTHGQIYVALSRVKTLEGLYIDDIDFGKINTNQQIVDFYTNIVE